MSVIRLSQLATEARSYESFFFKHLFERLAVRLTGHFKFYPSPQSLTGAQDSHAPDGTAVTDTYSSIGVVARNSHLPHTSFW